MLSRGANDPEVCDQCGTTLDYSYALAEFGTCQACTRHFNEAFIRGFGLVEGTHYERDAAGDVTAWCGDAPFAASAIWLTVCTQTPHWEDRPLAELVRATRRLLATYHGRLPPPFADPEAWH
jgi:hypothetical protein